MSSNKTKIIKTILTAKSICRCNKPKLSNIHQPKPVAKKTSSSTKLNTSISSSTASPNKNNMIVSNNIENTTTSETYDQSELTEVSLPRSSTILMSPSPKLANSLAVVKNSDDPHGDFKESMVQMIVEREMYSEEELQELLRCFLELNLCKYHDVIVQAFTDIWTEICHT